MKNIKKIILTVVTAVSLAALSGCSAAKTDTKPVTITVSAAASLKDSMEEIKTLYTKDHSNVTITYNFGASGTLQQQIEQGAEADLFISAAPKQMDALKSKGLISEDTCVNLLSNKVVLVVPKDSTLTINDFKSLADASVKKIALGEPKSVPAGQYAEQIFTKLSILDTVKSKAVYGKDVKEVLTWVESGNVDAGVVYETDAKASSKVKIIASAPADSYSPVLYPAAVLKESKNADAAKEFLTYLSGQNSKTVFEKYGFTFMPK
ncbi:MAG: molybdate ABC transporter substrate-binding protein [Clostridiaceae bacterium]